MITHSYYCADNYYQYPWIISLGYAVLIVEAMPLKKFVQGYQFIIGFIGRHDGLIPGYFLNQE